MEFRQYDHGSSAYEDALRLRLEVLRTPLGLSFSPAELASEAGDLHLGAFEGTSIVGTLILTPVGSSAKMRQVAVVPARQGQGVGGQLVLFSEGFARSAGFGRMTLHARVTAVPFYENLGYSCVGDPFEEVTILHRAMEKSL